MFDEIVSWRWSVIIPIAFSATSLVLAGMAYRSNNRRARLMMIPEGGAPSAYGLMWGTASGGWGTLLLVRVPMVILNSGGQPGALLDGRLLVPESWAHGRSMEMHEFHDSLDPKDMSTGRFAHPIVVAGRSTEMRFAQFKVELPMDEEPPDLALGRHELVLLGRTDRAPAWHEIWRFHIEIDDRAKTGLGEGAANIHWNPADRGHLPSVG